MNTHTHAHTHTYTHSVTSNFKQICEKEGTLGAAVSPKEVDANGGKENGAKGGRKRKRPKKEKLERVLVWLHSNSELNEVRAGGVFLMPPSTHYNFAARAGK